MSDQQFQDRPMTPRPNVTPLDRRETNDQSDDFAAIFERIANALESIDFTLKQISKKLK